jgi:signal transduction histidine kinase/HAMP domain-containing protein
LNDVFPVLIFYIAILAAVLITTVIPKTFRRQAIGATCASIVAVIGIQVWAPAFRGGSAALPNLTTYIIILSALAILGFIVRQAMVGNIRTKLIVSFILIAFISLSSVVFFADRSSQANLTEAIGNNLYGLANGEAIQVAQTLDGELDKLKALALSRAVQDRAEAGTTADTLSPAEIKALDQQWRAADAANNSSDPLVASVLSDSLSAELLKYQAQFPENVEVFLTDLPGVSLATTDRTSDYLQSDEGWWQAAFKNGEYIGQPEFDASSKTLAINMAVAVRASGSDKIVGVLRTTVNINSLENVLQTGMIGRTGQSSIYLPDGQVIRLVDSGAGKYELAVEKTNLDIKSFYNSKAKYLKVTLDNNPSLLSLAGVSVAENDADTEPISSLNWYVGTHQDQSEALLPVSKLIQGNLILGIVVTVLATLIAVGLAQVLAGPITRLTAVASQVAAGDLTVKAQVTSRDETGTLAMTFNKMTAQLRDMIGTLEHRVAERTHDLELAAEVGRTITEKVDDLHEMLSSAVEMIRARFDLYYTQVYLADPSGRNLVLRAGTGEAGKELLKRGHHLPIDHSSLNGRAAADRKAVIVTNTALSQTFLPNPLLPNTRSEMAVPLAVGGRVIGVLDMQSEIPDSLNQGNLSAFEVLAGQLSVAIQNASLFAQNQEARQQVEVSARRMTVSGWREFMNSIDRSERIGYLFDQNETIAIDDFARADSDPRESIPITVTGAEVGRIQVVDESRGLTKQGQEILEATAAQLGQHLNNLRLLAQAERYRDEAEQAVRQLTHQGWESYLNTRKETVPGFVYDLNEVKPLKKKGNGKSTEALKQSLVVRDQAIGELEVELEARPESAGEILAAVADQLSSHIENLRLSEQNEKRAHEMETVAELSATTSTVLDPDRLLQTIVDSTKERFGVYHAHIYLTDETKPALILAAGAGEVGRKMTAEEHAIPLKAKQSLVARSARVRQAVIVNDVRSDPGFLPNPLLPETRSEMAVPMIVGNKVLGVFDVQSDRVDGFSDEDASIYTTMASQVAIALQNARLYVEQAATVTQLRELDRLKNSFLANMSHELRTPLNSILGFADVMLEELDGPLTENMDTDLQLIQKNGQHLLHLINDVLDMAKIEAGRMNLVPEKFVVQEVLDEVVGITSTLASEKSLALFVEKDSDPEVKVFADRTRLRQVMINLVNNAIKFTEKGKISIRAMQQKDEKILIAVKDTGIGIPPDKLETIFQEFAQIDTSTTRKAGGTGLGLPISRRLVEMHGGRLWAESKGVSGKGSTFYVELPLEARISEPIEKLEK